MKGLGVTPKQMSIIFLVVVIFVSLALSGYSFLVSNHAASLVVIKEGLENEVKSTPVVPIAPADENVKGTQYVSDKVDKEDVKEPKDKKDEKKPLGWLSTIKSSLGMNELK